jgi:glycosyltransferase involved in cell wall biosynthesis
MTDNFVSILMPVKNAGLYIQDSISSILAQTYTDFELIIIDDGSTDSTAEIIGSFNDDRIKFFKRENLGLIDQLNFGIQISKGKYIARMDADDIAEPEKLGLQIEFLKSHKDYDLVGTCFEFTDEKGKRIMTKTLPENHEDIEFMMPFIDSVLHSTIVVYKNVLEKAGGYNLEYSYAEDDELFLRLLLNGCRMYNIRKSLYKYRLINRPYKHFEIQNSLYYRCGYEYLEKYYREKNGEYYLRLGLLEYYRGSIKSSRKYLLKSLKFGGIKKRYILRYLPVTFLGNSIVNYLRKKKITSRINSYFNNNFKIDTYNIDASKIRK